MKYTPMISDWAKGRRQTVQVAFQHWLQRGVMEKKYKSMETWRYDRALMRPLNSEFGKHHRGAVGLVRAFGAPNFFRGCYVGAEND
jgi:hypothetical protein